VEPQYIEGYFDKKSSCQIQQELFLMQASGRFFRGNIRKIE
jgi:hypothetical protein